MEKDLNTLPEMPNLVKPVRGFHSDHKQIWVVERNKI